MERYGVPIGAPEVRFGEHVLPLQRTDRATLAAEFETLTPESRRRRFLAPVMHLSDAMLEHLVDDVDGIDHVALVLCAELEWPTLPYRAGRLS